MFEKDIKILPRRLLCFIENCVLCVYETENISVWFCRFGVFE